MGGYSSIYGCRADHIVSMSWSKAWSISLECITLFNLSSFHKLLMAPTDTEGMCPFQVCLGDEALLVTVVFQMSLVAVLLQDVVRVAAGQPISSWRLRIRSRRLSLLALPAPRDWSRETWRERDRER